MATHELRLARTEHRALFAPTAMSDVTGNAACERKEITMASIDYDVVIIGPATDVLHVRGTRGRRQHPHPSLTQA
jgi:hypothetical protein